MNLFQRKIKSLNSNYGLLSESKEATTHRFVLIDVMGILSKLYQYCDVTGGSFSLWEVSARSTIMFKRPVIVGPKMRNFEEDIVEFQSRNLIIQVMDEDDLKTVLVKFQKTTRAIEQSVRAYNYVNVKMEVWRERSKSTVKTKYLSCTWLWKVGRWRKTVLI